MEPAAFVRANTHLVAAPYLPEIRLHLADDAFGLWEQTEREFGRLGLPPPFWAFAWAGGQGIARYLLDHPELVRGRSVLDLAAGSGVVAIAAALAGARAATAVDIDPFAAAAITLNAQANGVEVESRLGDVLAGDGAPAEVVLTGDVFYERAMAGRVLPFLERARDRGAAVLVGDPGRSYLPRDRFEEVASYQVPVPRALEAADFKRTAVWQLVER
jgi:predicted nicotinamide N-methyase